MKRFWKFWKEARANDPVKHCQYYKDMGCAHVDGMLCDMKTCKELKDYKNFLG